MIGLREHIAANITHIRRRLSEAAERSGRNLEEVTIVAVTKTFGPEHLLAAYELGLRHFGENRVEEAAEKLPTVRRWLADREKPTWHMIGHLQRRKANAAFDESGSKACAVCFLSGRGSEG